MGHAAQSRLWRDGKLAEENFPLEKLSDYLQEEGCLVWVDLCDPDHKQLLELADEMALDPMAVEDAVSHKERPKATRYKTHLFLTTAAINYHEGDLEICQISSFGFKRGIITVRASPDFDMDRVVRNWDENDEVLKFGLRGLVWGLLDVVVDGYFTAVEELDDEIESIEDILFEDVHDIENTVQKRSYAMRKSLVRARRVILPMREVVNTIMHRAEDTDEHYGELAPYLQDLYDHVLRAGEWTESLRDMISSVFETNLSLADSRLNTIMKKLTSWAAIIAVPTAITGFYGQNVPYPGFGHVWGFWISTLLTVGIALLLYLTYKRKNWL